MGIYDFEVKKGSEIEIWLDFLQIFPPMATKPVQVS